MMVLPKGLKDHVDPVICAFEPLRKDHGITDIFANTFTKTRHHSKKLFQYYPYASAPCTFTVSLHLLAPPCTSLHLLAPPCTSFYLLVAPCLTLECFPPLAAGWIETAK